jgi:DNA-binding response OmpR family regulator
MKGKGKVLVIEDDESWQNNLREFLELEGFYVEVVSDLEKAIQKVEKEIFHFITIDMNLDETKNDPENFEGWDILKKIEKLRIKSRTPTYVITGYGEEYHDLKGKKKLEAIFFMDKAEFDRKEFIETIKREVDRINLKFFNDHRGNELN